MTHPHPAAGFTLIELSVVLVILGLLVGGVLVGRDLIAAAEVRGAGGQIERYETAIGAFRLKYNALPGDLTSAQAAMFGFQSRTDGVTVSGDNGAIEFCAAGLGCPGEYAQYRLGSENVLFWRDLSQAGLISETFNTATDAAVGALTGSQIPLYVPKSKLPGNFVNFGTYNYVQGSVYFQPNTPYTFYTLKSIPSTAFNSTISSPLQITAATAYRYDSKFDDGNPITGTVIAGDYAGGVQPHFLETPAATTCRATATTYNVTYGDPACRLSILSKAWPR